jgi:hypothetical protein
MLKYTNVKTASRKRKNAPPPTRTHNQTLERDCSAIMRKVYTSRT